MFVHMQTNVYICIANVGFGSLKYQKYRMNRSLYCKIGDNWKTYMQQHGGSFLTRLISSSDSYWFVNLGKMTQSILK